MIDLGEYVVNKCFYLSKVFFGWEEKENYREVMGFNFFLDVGGF